MASKTICIKEEIYIALNKIRKEGESFSELLERILTQISQVDSNYEIIMKEVFGCAKDEIPDEILTNFSEIKNEIEKKIDEQFELRDV